MAEWKAYEDKVKTILEGWIKRHRPMANLIVYGSRYWKDDTGELRQVDASAEILEGGVRALIVCECKYHSKEVNRKLVEDFIALKNRLHANQAFFFSPVGFDEGAKRVAKRARVSLIVQRLDDDRGWEVVVPMILPPVLLHEHAGALATIRDWLTESFGKRRVGPVQPEVHANPNIERRQPTIREVFEETRNEAADPEDGDATDMADLGLKYAEGRAGFPKDDALAVVWLRKAADAGDATGMAGLSYMYAKGRGGLPKDDALAANWSRKAADAGNGTGMANLGLMYAKGRGGLPKDDVVAVNWYRKAAAAGDTIGMTDLASMYAQGRGGLPKDDALALHWYRKAADAGDKVGMANLGWMYETGRGGLRKDDALALSWYRKAADAGTDDPYVHGALKRLSK